jgi:hypothetical protein
MAVTVWDGGCVICSRPPSQYVSTQSLSDGLLVKCPQCGRYQTSVGRQSFDRMSLEHRSGLSCATRQTSEAGQVLKITAVNAIEIAEPHTKTRVSDNQERLLRAIARRAGRPHKPAPFSYEMDFTLIDCQSAEEFEWYIEWLVNERLAFRTDAGPKGAQLTLSMEGWKRVQPVPRSGGIPGRCFVAMWFADSMNEVFELGISRAVTDCGLPAPIRIDRKEHNNQITDEIMAEIRDAEFVIADFSGNRGGVYYEAGFARGLGRPVVHCCRDSDFDDRHFDTKLINHIKWSDANDLRQKLANRIKATLIPKA